jgi:phosphoketolase
MKTNALAPDLLSRIDAYWRAANDLSVGQIYLYDNPLLKRPLTLVDVKRMLPEHWGTTPGQNFIYTHLNRVIKEHTLDMIYVSGPGHGGPAAVRHTYLEGTITTPFDMTVLNDLDRFHLVMDTLDRLPQTGDAGLVLKRQLEEELLEHKHTIDRHGEDLPEIRDWQWSHSS